MGAIISVSKVHVSPASQALREIAADDPGRAAIEIDDRQISYEEFNTAADRLAQRLVREFGGERPRIAIRAADTYDLAVGFLAVQRAGMVAVPIDPTSPEERLQTILHDVDPALMLSDVAEDTTSSLGLPVARPFAFSSETVASPIDRDRDELVSIVYTSGSTGAPKGIMMGRDHVNALWARLSDYQVPRGTRLGALVAGTVSHAEIVVGSALVARGTLVAYEIRRHGLAGLVQWLQNSKVDSCYMVPSVLRYVLPTLSPSQHFPELRTVLLSGETATWDDVRRLRRHLSKDAVIVNVFGQTETVSIASFVIPGDMEAGEGPLPAGRISPGMEVQILQPDGSPAPTGHAGEIVVTSRALSLGSGIDPI